MAEMKEQAPKDDSALLSAIGIDSPFPKTSRGLRDVRESILVKKGEAEEATAEAKRRAALTREAGEGALYKAEREATEPMRQELLAKTQDRVYPPPARDSFKDFAAMFSVLSALSFAVGGKGRGAGMAGLAALNGAIDGFNRGDKDAFDRGMKEYDKKLAEYKTSLEATREALRVVSDREGLKTKEGIAALKTAELNDQGVAASLIRQGKIKDAINHVDNLVRKADAEEAKNQSVKDRQFLMDYAKSLKGEDEGKLKMGATERARKDNARSTLRLMNSVEEGLRDSKVKEEFDRSQLWRIILETPKEQDVTRKAISQYIFQEKLSPKTQELFTQIATARNDYFRQISGQAVTGSEAARNFFATVNPTDNSATLLNKINTVKPRLATELTEIVEGYQLPKTEQENIKALIRQNTIFDFASQQEADEAEKTGKIKKGDRVRIGNRIGTVE